IENGFYYDFKRPQGFSPEDLQQIEAAMRAIVAENLAVSREELPREEAVRLFESMGEHYKVEIIRGIPEDVVSLYRQGEFVHLCRGPHLPATGHSAAFRLTSVAGADRRGDSRHRRGHRPLRPGGAHAQALATERQRVAEAQQPRA